MTNSSTDENQLRFILRETLVEISEGKNNLFYDVVAEVLEDVAIASQKFEAGISEYTIVEDILE